MKVELEAEIDESGHLTVHGQIPPALTGHVKITLENADAPKREEPVQRRSFHEAIGGMYRRNPNAPRLSTAEWMKILREGEED